MFKEGESKPPVEVVEPEKLSENPRGEELLPNIPEEQRITIGELAKALLIIELNGTPPPTETEEAA